MLDHVITWIGSAVAAWIGSVEYRLRTIYNRVCETPSRREVHQIIDSRIETIKAIQQEIKEDIKEIKMLLNSKK